MTNHEQHSVYCGCGHIIAVQALGSYRACWALNIKVSKRIDEAIEMRNLVTSLEAMMDHQEYPGAVTELSKEQTGSLAP